MRVTCFIKWFPRVVIFLVYLAHVSVSGFGYERPAETPRDMTVGNGYIYLLTSDTLYQLHHNLTVQSAVTLVSGRLDSEPFKMILSENETEIVVCFANGQCILYDAEYLFTFDQPTSVSLPSENMAIVGLSEQTLYTGSEGIHGTVGGRVIMLGQYTFNYDEIHLEHSRILTVTNNTFTSRTFFDAVQSGRYVYFITLDSVDVSSSPKSITAMRVCHDEVGFSGIYEIALDCGRIELDATISSVSLDIDEMLIIGVSSVNHSRLCSFAVSDINRRLTSTFEECRAGLHRIPLPWAGYEEFDCSKFSGNELTQCRFGSSNSARFIPALASMTNLQGSFLLELWNYNVTTALPINSDEVSLVYIGASNMSGNFLFKYRCDGNGVTTLLEEHAYSSQVSLLRFRKDNLYIAKANEVLQLPVSNCPQYNDCRSCTASNDPFCGWCVLEEKCSKRSSCRSHFLLHRWVQDTRMCISQVILVADHLSVEDLASVKFRTIPSTSNFPAIRRNETYNCVFTNTILGVVYNLSLLESGCVMNGTSLTELSFSHISLNFSIVPVQSGLKKFHSNSVVTLFNCSRNQRCSTCQRAPPCGWCIYDSICTGNYNFCRAHSDWISAVDQIISCPMMLPPMHMGDHYLQPAGVSRELNLTTRHVPPPIQGYKYICRVRYYGLAFDVAASYLELTSEEHAISCQFQSDQFALSSQIIMGGSVQVQLSLLLVETHGTFEQEIEYFVNNFTDIYQIDRQREPQLPLLPPSTRPPPNLLIYDCSQLSSSCSSCLSLNMMRGFACGWCTRQGASHSNCVVQEDCYDAVNSFFNTDVSGAYCPDPRISSLYPVSGPIQGGTTVTISGIDLGVSVTDIMEILFGGFPCILQGNEYIPGTDLKCTTSDASAENNVDVTVKVRKGERVTEVRSPFLFFYGFPKIDIISPAYGPRSGGTHIIIRGSSLNISDPAKTAVRVGGQECAIQSVTSAEISCATSPHDVGRTPVQLIIDSADFVHREFYRYLPDPIFLAIYPQNTIISGGITLTFAGRHLNNTEEAVLVVYDGGIIHTGVCQGITNYNLLCVAPKLQPVLANGEYRKRQTRSREESLWTVVNYTVIMDNAPGPDASDTSLTLYVKPDPVFTEIQETDRVYIIGSTRTISILGRNLDSVSSSEIMVTVGNTPCKIVSHKPNVLQCNPPDVQAAPDSSSFAEVKVNVGNGTLEYSVGNLQYKLAGLEWTTIQLLSVTLGSLTVIVVLIFVCVLVICIATRRKQRRKSRTNEDIVCDTREERFKLSHNDRNTVGGSANENLYEDINDVVFPTVSHDFSHQDMSPLSRFKTTSNSPWNGTLERSKRSLPEVPSEEYIEMATHSLRCQKTNDLANPRMEILHEGILQGHCSGEYVDMLPIAIENKGQPLSKHAHDVVD